MKNFIISDKSIKTFTADKAVHLSFGEKIRIAGLLDDTKVDIIEIPAPQNKTDEMFIKTAAVSVKKSSVAVDTGYTIEGVNTAYECIRYAASPVLNICFPVSTVQMEYICRMKAPVALKTITECITAAKEKGVSVEFTAEDAGRAESDFLYKVITAACEAGADIIAISDEAAKFTFDEYEGFIKGIYENVPAIADKKVIVDISDEIDMSTACLYTAVKAGVDGVKTAVGSASCCSLSKTVDFIKGKGEALEIASGVSTSVINKNIETIIEIASSVPTGMTHELDSAFGAEVSLSDGADFDTVCKTLDTIGYDLSDADKKAVYEAFTDAAAKKSTVSAKELDEIVASVAMQVPAVYELSSYVINSGNIITAMANVSIEKDGKQMLGVGVGDGPIDASFNAIENITGHHYELDDFQIQSLTEGRQALGRAVVCLRSGSGKLYSGRGISTDIIGASILAYVNALNKIAYEENR